MGHLPLRPGRQHLVKQAVAEALQMAHLTRSPGGVTFTMGVGARMGHGQDQIPFGS